MYFNIFEQSPLAIELYDEAGKLINANSAFLELLGFKSIQEIANFNLLDKPNLPPKIITEFKKGIRNKYEFEYGIDSENRDLISTRDKSFCNLYCKISSIINVDAKIAGYIVYTKEIKDNKQGELHNETNTLESSKQNGTRDKLLSIIAHDLKNPFNAIIGFTELMLKNFDQLDDETLLRGLKTIESASNQAYQLLDYLLIWTKNQSGLCPFNPEKLNLRTQLEEILKSLESSIINKQIKITISIKRSIYIFADKYMIDFILKNLISNAIKFSYKGGKIKISAERTDQELLFSMEDQGIGISEERQTCIFDIEKRSSTIGTENESGTGMALILCKDFVTLHDGKIWVESTPGIGSTFSFSLPAKYST